MTNGAQTTGTRDEHYNLVSVLYAALQAAKTYGQYISDAELPAWSNCGSISIE